MSSYGGAKRTKGAADKNGKKKIGVKVTLQISFLQVPRLLTNLFICSKQAV